MGFADETSNEKGAVMNSKTRVDYWLKRYSYRDGVCWTELEREELDDGWHRSVLCAKVARFEISFPGTNHGPVRECKEHKEELLNFNNKAVASRL
jgi:hypothetical protein